MTPGGPATETSRERQVRPRFHAARGAAAPPAGDRAQARTGSAPASARGAITAEFAVALPAVLLLLAMVLAGSAAGVTQLRFEEAARSGARALARGESAADVDGIVRRLAGASARSVVTSDGGWSCVTVSGRVQGTVGPLMPWALSARAWVRRESGPAPGTVGSIPGPVRSVPERPDRPEEPGS